MEKSDTLDRLIEESRVFHCVDCGKCTGACPLAQVDRDFSPRLIARHVIEEGLGSEYIRERVWSCLTCGLCDERCLQGIPFTHFIRNLRLLLKEYEEAGHLSHGGCLQGLMRMQTALSLNQSRLDWISPDLKISSQGEILYFVGCLSFFNRFFPEMDLDLLRIAVDTVRILNGLGIEPVVLPNERCCGHDLIWTGDELNFQRLRRINMESFKKAGAKTIITACGECSYVLGHLYPQASDAFPFEVMHLSEFLRQRGFNGQKSLGKTVTYQDPCRLGRFQGIYEAPRELLGSIAQVREMPHFGPGAWCCGNSSWLHCDRFSKQMQVERLMEAKGTKSDLVVTACPKCQIHLTCAMSDVNRLQDLHIDIQDMATVLAETMA